MLAVIGSGSAPRPHAPQERHPRRRRRPSPLRSREKAPEPQTAPSPPPSRSPPPATARAGPHAGAGPRHARAGSRPARAASPSASGTYLTPLVRKLAAEKGVDVGVAGRHRRRRPDPQGGRPRRRRQGRGGEGCRRGRQGPACCRSAGRTAPKPAAAVRRSRRCAGTTEKASRLRQIIAERMVDALHSQAQLTTVVEVDVTKIARLRAKAKDDFKAREGVNLTFLPFFVLAAIEALKAYPKINGVLEGNQITYHGQENVGIAVDTERGLARPGHPRRGRPQPRRHLAQDRRPGRAHAAEQGHAGRAERCHVHRDQHGFRRRDHRHPDRPRRHVRDPRHGRDRQASRSSSRTPTAPRSSRSGRCATCRCRTTTAWSTAPTRRATSPRSSSASRRAAFESEVGL